MDRKNAIKYLKAWGKEENFTIKEYNSFNL